MPYRFKQAALEQEFEQIFALTHRVFAQELGQYPANPAGRLVDKFHHKNRYVIALDEDHVVGMICYHSEPPFSVEQRLPDLSVLREHGKLIEVRLLAVEPGHRNGRVMAGLMLEIFSNARHFDSIVISGVAEEVGMYRQMGFRELGPPVRSGEASFVPMAVKLVDLAERQARWERLLLKSRTAT